jgi:hypothetical protein
MSEAVYTAFRVAARNVLVATVALSILDEAPAGWQRFIVFPSKSFRPQLLLSTPDRMLLSTSTTLNKKKSIDLSLIRYGGAEEPTLITEDGFQGIAHEGQQTSLNIKGVLSRASKPQSERKRHSQKPPLQHFHLSSVGHTKAVVAGEDSQALWVATRPLTSNYIAAGDLPRGGEAIVKLTEGVVNFLEGLTATSA